MSTMYNKDLSQRITLRLSDEDFDWICNVSATLNQTPSQFIRSLLRGVKYTSEHSDEFAQVH